MHTVSTAKSHLATGYTVICLPNTSNPKDGISILVCTKWGIDMPGSIIARMWLVDVDYVVLEEFVNKKTDRIVVGGVLFAKNKEDVQIIMTIVESKYWLQINGNIFYQSMLDYFKMMRGGVSVAYDTDDLVSYYRCESARMPRSLHEKVIQYTIVNQCFCAGFKDYSSTIRKQGLGFRLNQVNTHGSIFTLTALAIVNRQN